VIEIKKIALWLFAFILTISTAIYQRRTGPTYPLQGKVALNDSVINYKLIRSHEGKKNHEVTIKAENREVAGYVIYKRYKTTDSWTKLPILRKKDFLVAELPHQPPAGKLEYKVILTYREKQIFLSGGQAVIIRFKGKVPPSILFPHIIIMFLAMLFSNRAGLEALLSKGSPRKYAFWVIGLLFAGGIILGPLVQKFAFGAFWTGFPLGSDLTDTKMLLAFLGWIIAAFAARKQRQARWWILGAAILLLVVYMIPHSLLGSELDYSKMNSSLLSNN